MGYNRLIEDGESCESRLINGGGVKLLRVAYYQGDDRYQPGWWAVVDHGDGQEWPHFLWSEQDVEPDFENLARLVSMVGRSSGVEMAIHFAKLNAKIVDLTDEE